MSSSKDGAIKSMFYNVNVSDAIKELDENINEARNKIALIKSIDFTKPVTENQWHEICETPLRSSELLAVLVKNTFPLAENITVHYNYVYFDMLGFKVQIPTSHCHGINVDTSWYERDCGEPILQYTRAIKELAEYFDAVDNKKGWYECAKHRVVYGKTCEKWLLFFVWWFKYKWKDPKRKLFEEEKSKQEQRHKKQVEKYYSERKEMQSKVKVLVNDLLPLLNKFSAKHSNYDGRLYGYSIEEIRKLEKI